MSNLVATDQIGLRDKSNPRSLVNIVPLSVSKAIDVIPDSIFEMTDGEIRKIGKIDQTEELLRINFWLEYDRAQMGNRKMNITNVICGVCSLQYFQKNIVSNSFKMAYIARPPIEYTLQIEDLLRISLEQMRDILLLPHVKPDGSVDAKLADVKTRIHDSVELRARGAVPHRVETKNLNVNVDSQQTPLQRQEPLSLDDINKRLLELEGGITSEIKDVGGDHVEEE